MVEIRFITGGVKLDDVEYLADDLTPELKAELILLIDQEMQSTRNISRRLTLLRAKRDLRLNQ